MLSMTEHDLSCWTIAACSPSPAPDRASFLQGLVSNDVDKIGGERAVYAALLTAQGKYLHDFIMVEVGEAIWLDAEAARLADLKRRLSMYRLRAKVAIDERPDLGGRRGVRRRRSPRSTCRANRARRAPFDGGVAFVDPRLAALGARAILPRDAIRPALAEAGLAEADFADYDRLRLDLGIPDGSRDLVLDKSILLEAGLRRTERRRLAKGLLYRPGTDRPHQIPRPDQKAAVPGADRRPRPGARHDRHARRPRGRRDALEPRRHRPRVAAPGLDA